MKACSGRRSWPDSLGGLHVTGSPRKSVMKRELIWGLHLSSRLLFYFSTFCFSCGTLKGITRKKLMSSLEKRHTTPERHGGQLDTRRVRQHTAERMITRCWLRGSVIGYSIWRLFIPAGFACSACRCFAGMSCPRPQSDPAARSFSHSETPSGCFSLSSAGSVNT